MIKAENLVKTFVKNEKRNKKTEFNAVDGISLEVGDGEIVGILGPNGAGKTTLLRMLSSLMKPTSGSVTITLGEGKEILKDQIELRRHIGYHSGNTKLYGRLSTREMLSMFGTIYGLTDEVIGERIDSISKVLSMDEFIDNRIEKLSTGQTQRAAIARCLIHDPEIYIFDEPTLGLDIISSAAITKFMKGEKDRGRTVIYSTHYMEEAEYLCDRIVMINRGHIITDLTPEELKKETGTTNMRDAFNAIVEREKLKNEE
ncbi:MAG: ATP-binding cassette domain-containing protein [Eubacterium sp.]|nr:ATP-binding cassette domain-containing protein [Eubacterium sp.]